MRTAAIRLATLALLLGATVASAQPAPSRLSPGEEAALRAELKRLEIEHVGRYFLGATAYEGIFNVTGQRTITKPNAAAEMSNISGELTLVKGADGKVTITGKMYLEGRNTGKFEGSGELKSDKLTGTYKATVAGAGTLTIIPGTDGALRLAFTSTDATKATGNGTCTRAYPITRAALEKRLFEANVKLQAHRYPRPEPVRYRTATRKTEFRFTPSVEFDPNGVESQVIGYIDAARTSIDLAVFEFSLPKVAEALVRAKERGVKVRMVYDNQEEDQPSIKILKDNQIPIRSDARSALMHNKVMLVDGDFVWTGSTNLAPNGIYVADNNAVSFRNAALAAEYKKEFEEMFVDGKFGPTSPSNTTKDWMVVDTGVKLQVRFSPEDGCMDRLIEAVKTARRSIKFMAFAYTSEALFEAMKERMAAGVTVEGIFESRHAGWTDIKIGPLAALGAKVRFDVNPNAMHHKVIVIDDKLLCTGSFNFSDGADTSNDENLLIIDCVPMARAAAREFASIMGTTDPNDPRVKTSGMGATTSTTSAGPVNGLATTVDETADPTPPR